MSPRKFLIIFGSAFASIFLLVGGVLLWAFTQKGFVSSPGIDLAVALVRGDARVTKMLGDSFEIAGVSGGSKTMGKHASVDAVVSLAGAEKTAELHVVGFRIGEQPWAYSTVELRVPGQRIEFAPPQ